MSLANLLAAQNIRSALIVDDVYDSVPTANDIDPENEAWSVFIQDLPKEAQDLILDSCPQCKGLPFNTLITKDEYVSTLWNLRAQLKKFTDPLFHEYTTNQTADMSYVDLLKSRLENLDLTVRTAGRDFEASVTGADIIIIDLFLGTLQGSTALEESKRRLRDALKGLSPNFPLVILMSRSSRLEGKRDEFRDEVGLLDSRFRILRKEDIQSTEFLEIQLRRLAENNTESNALATLFQALEIGVSTGADRALQLLRRLRLSDLGQIQHLLLDSEGQPAGSYLVDLFDGILSHEIEREDGIIEAAKSLNSLPSLKYSPPYVSGSANLQELVHRLVTQNKNRLKLASTNKDQISFGDLLKLTPNAPPRDPQAIIFPDATTENIFLVITPACDLQHDLAPRVLLLVGTLKPVSPKNWTYGNDARTPAILIGDEIKWVKWDLKHIETASPNILSKAIDANHLQLLGRLRLGHALELQQRVLTGLGRIGQLPALPGTFPVKLKIFFPNLEESLEPVPLPTREGGAVCFVGRDEDKKPMIRLALSEDLCDDILLAISKIDENTVAKDARKAFNHIKSSHDLTKILTQSIDLKGVTAESWKEISSISGNTNGVSKLGLIAWNLVPTEKSPLGKGLSKAGIVFLIQDSEIPDTPGLTEAIQSGLIIAGEC